MPLRRSCSSFRGHYSLYVQQLILQHQKALDSLLPGYLPPLFLLMKQTISKIKMRRATAHIRPMNQPWVAISTCRLAIATKQSNGLSGNRLTSQETCVGLFIKRQLPQYMSFQVLFTGLQIGIYQSPMRNHILNYEKPSLCKKFKQRNLDVNKNKCYHTLISTEITFTSTVLLNRNAFPNQVKYIILGIKWIQL